MDEFSLEGKNAIVTGGGTGLGKVMCLAFARAGANVVIAGRRPGPINEVSAEVMKLGRKAVAISTDITDSKQVNNLIQKSLQEFGRIDILVNNAGIAKGVDADITQALIKKPKPIWEMTDEEWAYSINTNLTGTFYCCRAIAKFMQEQKSGKVINLSSTGGMMAAKGDFGYRTAKAGIIMLTKNLAITWASDNIQVNCIAPGFLPTEELPENLQENKKFFPMGRFGDPHEIGPLAVYLASKESNYITGQCFIVNGAAHSGYAPTGYIPSIPL